MNNLLKAAARFYSVRSSAHLASASELSYDFIPLVSGFPVLGSLHNYRLGKYSKFPTDSYIDALVHYKDTYGSLVRENLGFGREVLHVFSPDDARTILMNESKMPLIVPLQESVQLYRSVRGLSLGLGNLNGPDWYRLRQGVQQFMMRAKALKPLLPLTEDAVDKFVHFIASCRTSSGEISDFRNAVRLWSLEASANVVCERSLNAIGCDSQAVPQQMINANQDIFELTGKLKFSLPVYKFFSTPKWRKLVSAEDFFFSNATKLIEKSISELREGAKTEKSFTFLKYLLSRSELSHQDIVIISLSLFGDGLNTTAPALIYNLYCLAKNPMAQEKLREEVNAVFPKKGGSLDLSVFDSLHFMKACIKEAARLYPVGTELSRILEKDLVLSGYNVPKGTAIDINLIVHLKDQKYFSEPNEFSPERWLRSSESYQRTHPFLLIPFGHGPRMCAGRRFAEHDLYICLGKIIQNFSVEFVGDDFGQRWATLLHPKGACRFTFNDL